MTLKTILQEWAENNQVNPAELARLSGYSYQHAYNLLRGGSDVTAETMGRILLNLPATLSRSLFCAVLEQKESPSE